MSSWETLEQDAISISRNPYYHDKCKFAIFLESLDSKARSHVENALSNDKISGKALYRALRDRGMDCKHTVFHEHRKSTCVCFIKRD
jgi:hypothetical protein